MFACSDLEACSAWLEEETGVRPAFGGVHAGRGTHNALMALGGNQYLELIAPDPKQPDIDLSNDERFKFGGGGGGRLVHWAAVSADLAADCQLACATAATDDADIRWSLTEPRPHSRLTPDGTTLNWSLCIPKRGESLPAAGLLPFLIDWGDTPHPAHSSPPGVVLDSFLLVHPRAAEVGKQLERVGLHGAPVSVGPTPSMVAVLQTPKGLFRLESTSFSEPSKM